MNRRTLFELLIVVAVTIIFSLMAKYAHADCTFVYKPGDVLYVDAGSPVTIIIEGEPYKLGKVPDKYLPLPTESNLQEMARKGQHSWYCGESRDITDADLD